MNLIKKKGNKKGPLPEKRTINFAVVDQKKKRYDLAILGSSLIIAAAAYGSRHFVSDRLEAVAKERQKVYELQKEIEATTARIRDIADMQDEYEHYTISGLGNTELSYTNRLEILDLVNRVVLDQAFSTSWTLNGNVLKLPITSTSLQDINKIVQQLEQEELVDYCCVTTAKTDDKKKGNSSQGTEAVRTGTKSEEETEVKSEAMPERNTKLESESESGESMTGEIVTAEVVVYLNYTVPEEMKAYVSGGKR